MQNFNLFMETIFLPNIIIIALIVFFGTLVIGASLPEKKYPKRFSCPECNKEVRVKFKPLWVDSGPYGAENLHGYFGQCPNCKKEVRISIAQFESL